jgi:hypothetical protein
MKLGMYIVATKPVSSANFINPYQSVCLYVYPCLSLIGNGFVYTFPWQRIRAQIEEILEASFSIWSVSYSVGLSVYLPIVARQWLGKQALATKTNVGDSFSMRSVSYRRIVGD